MTYWTNQVEFGVVHSLAFPECRNGDGPMVETLQVIVNDECFGAVEIAPIPDPELRSEVRRLLAAAEMTVVYLPILPIIFDDLGIGSADPDKRSQALTRLRALIAEAIEFNAPLAMVTGPKDPGPEQREATISRLVEDLQHLCDYADAHSSGQRLHLTFENFDRDVEKKRLVGPTAEAAQLATAVDRENFGLTVDLSHLPLFAETPREAIQAAGSHLIHAHIGNCVVDNPDCPFFGDFHPRFGHPEGRNSLPEVREFLSALDDAGYWERARERLGTTPILSMEIKPTPTDHESADTLLANGKRVFTRAWASTAQSVSA